ncbi:MAG: glutathione S-transferase family protein, partial [Phormidesmis sp.]
MKLFGHPDSGHALKVKFFLNWLGIPHEYEYVDIFSDRTTRSVAFLSASKFAEVPTLLDGEGVYIQSNAILVYLADKYEVFKTPAARQKCLEWLVWEANKIGLCLPQLRADKKLSGQYPALKLSPGAYEWLFARYQHDVNVLDRELSDDRQFILGQEISPA